MTKNYPIEIQRVYEAPEADAGLHFLVDRLWPRGIPKERLKRVTWLKNVAPSDPLRRWFGHDPDKWPEFKRRYFAELRENPQAWEPIDQAARENPVTLLFAAKDSEHNNAVALQGVPSTRTRHSKEIAALWMALAVGATLAAVGFGQEPAEPSASSPTVNSGFDASPKTLRAKVMAVDKRQRRILLANPRGPQIEMSVPKTVPIYAASEGQLPFESIRSGDTLRIRYHPLLVQAIAIWKT